MQIPNFFKQNNIESDKEAVLVLNYIQKNWMAMIIIDIWIKAVIAIGFYLIFAI